MSVVGGFGVLGFPFFKAHGFGSPPEGDKGASHERGWWDVGSTLGRGREY